MQKVVIYRIQDDSFHDFDSNSAFTLPQSENIFATNGCVIVTFCNLVSNLLTFEEGVGALSVFISSHLHLDNLPS
jgi:hypothetical protein